MQSKALFTLVIFGLLSNALCLFLQLDVLANTRIATRQICRNTRLSLTEQEHDYDNEDNCLRCNTGESIKIVEAVFGVKDARTCPIKYSNEVYTHGKVCDEGIETLNVVRRLCDGKEKCRINVRSTAIPVNPNCENEAGQLLQVKFKCVGSRIKFHPFAGNTFGGRLGDSYLTRGIGGRGGGDNGY